MSLNLNQVIIAGNLTRDPELRILDGGRNVCSFSVATNRRYKGADGEKKEETTFVECVAWGRTAELVCQYLTKGRPVYVEGRLTQDQWTDKEGKPKSKTKVTVENVQFLGSPKERQEGASSTEAMPPRRQPDHTMRDPVPPKRGPDHAAAAAGDGGMDEPPFMRMELP